MPLARFLTVVALAILAIAQTAHAGPPFVTDDPEPVDYLIFSAGSSIHGPVDFQCYAAYQFTFDNSLFHFWSNSHHEDLP
jgi:hypothetical protein